MKEKWKKINKNLLGVKEDFLYDYEISNCGRIRRKKVNGEYTYKLGHIEREITKNHKRYVNVLLKTKGKETRPRKGEKIGARHKSVMRRCHRIVATHFIPNPYNKPQINHKDFNKHNNFVTNLEWVTPKENCIHRELKHK